MFIKNKIPQHYKRQTSQAATPNSRLPYLLLTFFTVCAFLNTLLSGFVYDDIGVIEDNYFIRSFSNVPKIFSKDYFQLSCELTYRPVVTLSYFVDYALWGLNPSGYHLTNIILHAINSVLLYALLVSLTRARPVAFLSAVIFSIHPCVTEAVNAISYREDMLAALFSFLSCICLVQSKRRFYCAIALLSFMLSLFSKETSIVMPLFILLYWTLFMRKHPSSAPFIQDEGVNLSHPSRTNSGKCSASAKTGLVKYFVNYYLGYILISLFYLCVRFVILKNPIEKSAGYLKGSVTVNFMTMVKVLASYVKLMFLPVRLCADYTISPVLSMLDISFIISVMLLIAVCVIVFKTIKLNLSPYFFNKDRIYGFFMICFFAALLPVLNIVPIGHIMAERYLYLPVAGFCVIAGGLLLCPLSVRSAGYKWGKPHIQNHGILTIYAFTIPLISAICISLTAKTVLRNRDWRNEYTFWTKILKEQPQNHDAHNNLGSHFYKQGALDRAIRELEEAVRLKKNYPEGHNSLGTIYMDKGLIDMAMSEYAEAIKYKPVFPQAYYNLGNACIKKGLLDDGIAFFNKAISMGMYNPQVFNNLGSAYIKKGMMDEALAQYRKAVSVYRDFAEVHSNLGYVYTEKGDMDMAIFELKEALRLRPDHSNAHNNLGALYCRKGDWDMAEDEFLKAIRFDPQNASAQKNIGMIYLKKGDNLRAREHLLLMLKYDPNYIKDAGIHAVVLQLGLIKD